MKTLFVLLLAGMISMPQAHAFCGFFVAKADSKLFNKSSQVIIVRKGDRTAITMSNDFEGEVEDFAMVVPVPVILRKNQIRTVKQDLFTTLDNYSAPRMAEYYESLDPCYVPPPYDSTLVRLDYYNFDLTGVNATVLCCAPMSSAGFKARYKSVKIEAVYEVDEYDITILSAKESDGLKTWLNDNEYTLPEKAEEVLDPYIKNGMNFFVAKVNSKRLAANPDGTKQMSPLQIEFNSSKFMLPIRLGMANANGDQDLIIHAYTDKGRVECTNYRTVKMPTDINVPQFVKSDFGPFYKAAFDKQYEVEGQKAVFLEYAWDCSPRVSVHCDPCVGPPPVNQQLVNVGCDWVEEANATVFYTRLHVRYNRENFPQDLQFQTTPNNKRFQCRYVIHNPASSATEFKCEKGQEYVKKVVMDRKQELYELAVLTGWDVNDHQDYVENFSKYIIDDKTGDVPSILDSSDTQTGSAAGSWMIWMIAFLGLIGLFVGRFLQTSIRK